MDFDRLFDETFEVTVEEQNATNGVIDECRKLISEKFGDIEFVEEGHVYTIEGKRYTPVSDIIKIYEPEVDWDQKAADYALKHGRTKDDVQKEWRLNNLKATISGTRTHCFGESYTNLMCGNPELICIQNKSQYIGEYNTLVPTYPKEDAIKKFYDEMKPNIHPIGAEFRLSSRYIENALPICGTCDLLFYDSDKKGFKVYDWKTNKSLIKEYNRYYNIRMKGCVHDMYDEPLSHYRIQLNIYQKMLESIGLNIIDRVIVWLKDDGTYETIDVDKINDSILDKIMRGEK